MVSFRVSPGEYRELREACIAQGLDSVSELARNSIENLIGRKEAAVPHTEQINDLRRRLDGLSIEIERLARHMEGVETLSLGPSILSASATD